jgi:hypothetical protein
MRAKPKKIFIVHFSHKHGVDVSAFKTRRRAKQVAEGIRAEWYPTAKTVDAIPDVSFGEGYVEILETDLEE